MADTEIEQINETDLSKLFSILKKNYYFYFLQVLVGNLIFVMHI